jgi:hypothetical protein
VTLARAAVLAAIVAGGAGGCGRSGGEGLRTSIRPQDCTHPPADLEAQYTSRDLGVQQCAAPDPWRLLLVASDANTWLDLAGPEGIRWSGERPIVYESPIGNFPSVDPSDGVEWVRNWRGLPTALIFRVTAQDPESLTATKSMLFVLRLERRGTACLVGRGGTPEAARTLAAAASNCE